MFLFRRSVLAIVSMVVDHTQQAHLVAALNRTNDLAGALAAEKAANAELRSALAVAQANFDWLRVTVNELKYERAELYRKIGFIVPVPEIARVEPAPTLHGMDDRYVPGRVGAAAPDLGDIMAKARELKEAALKPKAAASGVSALDPLSFEDIGDDAAQQIGATHDATGELLYTR